jgi:hypothetical protein
VSLTLILFVTLASFLQVGALPVLFPDPWSVPLLPVALVAAWSVNRSCDEVWIALLPAAVLPGIVSTQRSGWFLMALLPVALIGEVVTQTIAGEQRGLRWRLPATASVAGLGTLSYLLLLAIVGRDLHSLSEAIPTIVGATLETSAIAVVLTPLLQPRRRRHGLFT